MTCGKMLKIPVPSLAILLGAIALNFFCIPMPALRAQSSMDTAIPHPPSRGRAGGTRGCNSYAQTLPENRSAALILLASPRGDIQTLASRPTFAWYVRDAVDLPLIFRIYKQPPASEPWPISGLLPILELTHPELRSQAGLVSLTLPDTVPALQPGERYLWQVELRCDPNDPSSGIFAEADIEVVTQPGSRPFWYDKLQMALRAPQQLGSAALRAALLTDAGVPSQGAKDLGDRPIAEVSTNFWLIP